MECSDYLASQSSVDLLMETFYRVRVKQDVPNHTFKTVINRLSVIHKKVEIFFNNDEISISNIFWLIDFQFFIG